MLNSSETLQMAKRKSTNPIKASNPPDTERRSLAKPALELGRNQSVAIAMSGLAGYLLFSDVLFLGHFQLNALAGLAFVAGAGWSGMATLHFIEEAKFRVDGFFYRLRTFLLLVFLVVAGFALVDSTIEISADARLAKFCRDAQATPTDPFNAKTACINLRKRDDQIRGWMLRRQ